MANQENQKVNTVHNKQMIQEKQNNAEEVRNCVSHNTLSYSDFEKKI